MITYSPATLADIAFVAENMWARGQDEMARFGYEGNADSFFNMITQNCVQAYRFFNENTGELIAILGISPTETGFCTAFQATDAFGANSLGVTKALRRFCSEWKRKNLGVEGAIYSASTHPAAAAWFGLIGFYADSVPSGYGNHIKRYLLR